MANFKTNTMYIKRILLYLFHLKGTCDSTLRSANFRHANISCIFNPYNSCHLVGGKKVFNPFEKFCQVFNVSIVLCTHLKNVRVQARALPQSRVDLAEVVCV